MTRTTFIADIGANHDGTLERALLLIRLAAESGADVVKFQHYTADTIVSREGFDALPKMAHQAAWTGSVVDTYRRAQIPWDWTPTLAAECERRGVEFMSTPYSLEAVDHLNPYVKRWKIGSGDITYRDLLEKVASTGKPVLLATGASSHHDLRNAWATLHCAGCRDDDLTIMQCNTDYTGGAVTHTNLAVLKLWSRYGPIGLSDHTRSLPVVLGAVALGASVIERHFTDSRYRAGPDHSFAMEPHDWRIMVDAVRELESALGDGVKKVEPNEREARIVQRRCWRAATDLPAGHVLEPGDLIALRPAPDNAISPMERVWGRTLRLPLTQGAALSIDKFNGLNHGVTTPPPCVDENPRAVA